MSKFSLTETSGLFLTKFQARSINHYNAKNVLDGRIKKVYDFVGRQKNIETQLSFSGGVGAKLLPKANTSIVEQAVITATKNYARTLVDRESLKAASSNEGAFQKFMAYPVKKTVESFARNSSRMMFGDGTGILGRGDGATNVTGAGTTGSPYIVTFRASDWNEANFEEQDFVQVVTGLNAGDNLGGTAEGGDSETNLLMVQEVRPSTRQVLLVGVSPVLAAYVAGPAAMATTAGLVVQRSYLAEPQGLRGVCMATSGSLYNIPVKRRWKSVQVDALGQGIVVDALNDAILQQEKATGLAPNIVMTNFNQMRKLLAQLEDQKVYNLPNKNLKGHMGFDGVQVMTSRGPIGVYTDRFCDEDKIYLLNDEHIVRHHRPDFGWFDDDGTVFLRTTDEDSYEARYGGYYQTLIDPTFQTVIHNLAK
jgi:hypothetical protein